MQRVLICAALAALSASSASAAFVDYDGFDYSGATLNDQSGGTGWFGPWIQTGTSPTIQLSDDDTSLSYPTGVTWQSPLVAPTPVGDRVRHTGSGTVNASSSRLLSQSTPMGVAGNVLYASALFQKNNGDLAANDSILIEFVDAAGNRRFGLGIEASEGFWLNANGSTQTGTATFGETYFLVAKLLTDDDAAPGDTAFLKIFGPGWSNEVPFFEPTSWDLSLSTNSAALLDRARIRIDRNQQNAQVDELRIGDSWQSVVSPVVSGPPQWNVDADGNWGEVANWDPQIVPDGATSAASFLGRITAPRTVTVDGNRTVNALVFDNANKYTIAGQGASLSIGDPTRSASVTVVSGSHEIAVPVDIVGNTNLTVAGGAGLTLSGGFGSYPGITLTKGGDGTLTLNSAQDNGSSRVLRVTRGTVNLDSNQGQTVANSLVLQLSGNRDGFAAAVNLNADQDLRELEVSVAEAGPQTFDLNSPAGAGEFHGVRVYSADLGAAKASLSAAIRNANAAGMPDASDGIIDSHLHASSGIGIAAMSDHVLIRSTRLGDLNLDGLVSIADFISLASNFNSGGVTWQEGDLNYDGAVTIADFISLASNFNSNYAGGLGGASADDYQLVANFASSIGVDGGVIGSAVPEPGTILVLALAGLGLMSRKRRLAGVR
jgi:hypothetical protein